MGAKIVSKSFQNQPQIDPKLSQNHSKIDPTSFQNGTLARESIFTHFSSHFGSLFGPPEPLKIVLSLWRGAIFCKNGMTRPGAQNRAQNDLNIETQTTPRGLQMAKKITPNRCSILESISTPILKIWGGPKWLQKAP